MRFVRPFIFLVIHLLICPVISRSIRLSVCPRIYWFVCVSTSHFFSPSPTSSTNCSPPFPLLIHLPDYTIVHPLIINNCTFQTALLFLYRPIKLSFAPSTLSVLDTYTIDWSLKANQKVKMRPLMICDVQQMSSSKLASIQKWDIKWLRWVNLLQYLR